MGAGGDEAGGLGCPPLPSQSPLLGGAGQRAPQTAQAQLWKAEGQRCINPRVKYKMAEWKQKSLSKNPKRSRQENETASLTPRKQGEARGESEDR